MRLYREGNIMTTRASLNGTSAAEMEFEAAQYSNPYSNPEMEEEWEAHEGSPYSSPEMEEEWETHEGSHYSNPYSNPEMEWETHEGSHYSNPYSNPEMEWEMHEGSHYSSPEMEWEAHEGSHYSNPYSNPEMEWETHEGSHYSNPIGVKLSRGPRRSVSGRKYSSEWTAWGWNSRPGHCGPSGQAPGPKAGGRPVHAPRWE